MQRADVEAWLDKYVTAWRSPGTAKLKEIFSEDVTYTVSPWKPPLKGLAKLEPFWERARSGPDEVFELTSEIVALDDNTAVVRLEVTYPNDQPSQWRDLWIMTFDEQGRCRSFEEWPFSPDQADGQD